MTTTLFYFTGSGNSLHIARELYAELENSDQGETELVSIPKVMKDGMKTGSDCIGIVFPVYCFGIPRMVSRFINTLEIHNDTYYFAICTHAGTPGQTLKQVSDQFEAKGMKLSAGFTIQMPVSGVIMYDVDPAEKQQKLFSEVQEKIREIATFVMDRKQYNKERGSFLTNGIFKLLRSLFVNSMYRNHLGFWADEKCNDCGICQAVCPTGNISISKNKPEWDSNCESCLACMNWCPNQAIQFKKKTETHGRYTNPQVKVNDLFIRELKK